MTGCWSLLVLGALLGRTIMFVEDSSEPKINKQLIIFRRLQLPIVGDCLE